MESGKYTPLDLVGLGYTNQVLLPNTAITMNPCDRKPHQQGLFNLSNLQAELKEHREGVLAFTCECSTPLPCPSNAVYLMDPAAHPECLEKTNTVTDSTIPNYETEEDRRARHSYQLMIQSRVRQPWGKAEEVPSNIDMDVLKAMIKREHPGLKIEDITNDMDEMERMNQEEGQMTFEEYRMKRRKTAGVSSSDDKEPRVEFIATKRKLLTTLEEAVEYPSEDPRVSSATKRERSSSDEEGEQGEAKRAKMSKPSGGVELRCHYCGGEFRKNQKKVNINLDPEKGFFAPIHEECFKENKTYIDMGHLDICHICKTSVQVNEKRKKVTGGKHPGKYVHSECLSGNRPELVKEIKYQADDKPGEMVDTDDEDEEEDEEEEDC